MIRTQYTLPAGKNGERFRAAVAADLHGSRGTEGIRLLAEMKPDFILIPGDLSNHFCVPPSEMPTADWNAYRRAMGFLKDAVKIAPVFYAPGNHEMGGIHSGRPWAQKNFPAYRPFDVGLRKEIEEIGVTFLDDSYVIHEGIAIGGLTSALTYTDMKPNMAFLTDFAGLDCYKLLLCHHPEYYPLYLRDLNINLTVSGHAHGGQWSFFGQAIFAPGQGLFPKLVRGVHENRLVISRGMTNSAYLPRICVPCEVLEISVGEPN